MTNSKTNKTVKSKRETSMSLFSFLLQFGSFFKIKILKKQAMLTSKILQKKKKKSYDDGMQGGLFLLYQNE